MKCPKCGSENHKVANSVESETMRRRRRLCIDCRETWATVEIPEEDYKQMKVFRDYIEKKLAERKAKKNQEEEK